MKNLKFVVLLFVSLIFTLSCSRKSVEESSTVKIVFPGNFSPLANTASISQLNEISPLAANWNTVVPATYNDINCLGVAVFGPDPILQQNKCAKSDGTAGFPVGLMIATVAKGQEVSLDIPSGRDRVIRLFGMKLASGTTCPNLFATTSGDAIMATMSKPYILGEVGALTLNAGEVKIVNIPVASTIDSSKYFEDCQGPLFNTGAGGGGGPGSPPVGSGIDGDVTVNSGMFDLRSINVPAGPAIGKPLVSISRVTTISVPNPADPNTLRIGVNDSSWFGTQKLAIGDEVFMYIAAASSNAGCGPNLFSGFPITGMVQAFPNSGIPDYSVFDIHVGDIRWGTIPPANLTASASNNSTFCRVVLSRVPQINNLNFNSGAYIDYNTGDLGPLNGAYHSGGFVYLRAININAATNSGIRMMGRGFMGGMYPGFAGESPMGVAPSADGQTNGSGGAGQFSVNYPGGGGYGGAGGNGYNASPTGGATIGDQYGCGNSTLHPNMECLFGKIFFGSGGGGDNSTAMGANGGGFIYISTGALNIPAGSPFVLAANGGMAMNPSSGSGGGGGSGGAIFLNVSTLNITGGALGLVSNGSIAGINSSGLSNAGGGGGGRVHLNVGVCNASAGSVIMNALGAPEAGTDPNTDGEAGANGTVFISGPAGPACDSISVKNLLPTIFGAYPSSISYISGGTFTLFTKNVATIPAQVTIYPPGNNTTPSCTCNSPAVNGNKLTCSITPSTCPVGSFDIVVTMPDGKSGRFPGINFY